MNPTMNDNDAIQGSQAECYVTIDGNRYNLMQIYEFKATATPNIIDVPILGRTGKGKKTAGWSGTWSGTAHYNTSIFLHYKKTGELIPFERQVSNEDRSSGAGRQTTIISGCLIDSLVLAQFNADDELLTEDISGTFSDFEMPEEFNLLDGME